MTPKDDHGEMLGSHGYRGKNIPEIESFNIPFIIKWGDRLSHRVEDLILSVPDVLPALLGLVGMEDKIPGAVQGTNYSEVLTTPDFPPAKKPGSALFINPKSRGVYTGKYLLVVKEEGGYPEEVYCYDNGNDPYQMRKIPLEKLDQKTGEWLLSDILASFPLLSHFLQFLWIMYDSSSCPPPFMIAGHRRSSFG